MELEVNISYPISENNSDRFLDVARAFGLDQDNFKTQTLYENFKIDMRTGDVVLINGPSGSGKSSLLNYLRCQTNAETFPMVDDNEFIIDGVGKNTEEAMKLLASVGLGEAFIMQKRFGQLSDGQKYRYKLAKILDSDKNIFVIDEFASLLDTLTAQTVAFGFQREIRRQGKTLICATCREDINEFLMPSLIIHKDFFENFKIERREVDISAKFPLLDKIIYRSVSKLDYNNCRLLRFHYRPHSINSAICILFGYINDQVVNVLVSAYPSVANKARNIYTNKKYMRNSEQNLSEALSLLNKEVATIKRVVVDPRFRGVGLGVHIVKEYLSNWATRRLVETSAVMAKYNPFFEKAGMKPIPAIRSNDKVEQKLEKLGFIISKMRSLSYNQKMIEKINDEQSIRTIVKSRMKNLGGVGKVRNNELEYLFNNNLARFLCLVPQDDTVWLGWENENYLENPPKTEKIKRSDHRIVSAQSPQN